MKFGSRRTILGIVGTVIVCVLSVALASGQTAPAPKPQMAEEVFKNIPALKGIPVDEFMDTMGMFAAALSMNCIDCHTDDSSAKWENFAKETTIKQTARRMILMVNALNRNNFMGERRVTCWTCHRGDPSPEIRPNLTVQYGLAPDDPSKIFIPPMPLPGTPTVDEVFQKYTQALGGAQRLAALTSFTAKGTYEGYDTDHLQVPVEIFANAPNQRTTIVRAHWGDSVRTFDGRTGWIAGYEKPVPLLTLSGGNLDGASLEALVSFPARLRQAFNEWRVTTILIDNNLHNVLQGVQTGRPPVNFYFDQSGLLVRILRQNETLVGPVPVQTDYSDYRDVAGVKVAFKWTDTWTDNQSTTQLAELQPNVAIDAARFAMPAPAKPQQPK